MSGPVPRPTLVAAVLAVALGACSGARPSGSRPGPPRELVVLVHGMGRTPLSMAPMALALRRSGYRVLNVGYSSQGPSVAEIGAGLAAEIDAELERAPAPRVHIVGHSLGTVAARWVLAHDPPPVPGRVVMLAPPNRGSRAADRLAGAVGWLLPPIRELRTTDTPAADLVLPDGVEVAVIAGDRDGKVSVAETCLAGAHHAVVRSRHTFIMMRPRVVGLVRAFLATGQLPGASRDACAAPLADAADEPATVPEPDG